MSPVAGFVRNRRHQFARQAAINTPIAAKRAYLWKGVPSVNPNWTDPDVDAGSVFPVAAPYRGAGDYTAPLTIPSLRYNDLPILMCGTWGGGVTPTGSGTAKTWAHAAAAVAPAANDLFTYEFGDDVTSDWYQMYDGIIETLEITGPTGLGALQASVSWRFGGVNGSGFTDFPDSPTVPTSLSPVQNEAIVYLKDLGIYIASDPDDLATSQIEDTLHNFRLRIQKTIDQKRFANGDQSFDIDEYGVSSVAVELECTFAKTADIVGTGSESDAWFSEEAVDRFVQLSAVSKVLAETPSTFYGWDVAMPMRYYTRTEGEVGGNSAVVLNGHAFYEPTDFAGAFTSEAVTTLANTGL